MGKMSRIAKVPSSKIYSCQAIVATALTTVLYFIYGIIEGVGGRGIKNRKIGMTKFMDGLVVKLPYLLLSTYILVIYTSLPLNYWMYAVRH